MQGALLWLAAGVCIGVVSSFGVMFIRRRVRLRGRRLRARAARIVSLTPTPESAAVVRGSVDIVRPNPTTVEGLEIRYAPDGLVRSVRIGALNSEHKELLLTMDTIAWKALPNSQKQEVLAVARSTWAAKMCPDGPDIAYVVLKTEAGDIVGRADPHSVRII